MAQASQTVTDPIDLKGEMNMQNILHIHTTDVRDILHALAARRDEAPQFFLHSPLMLDCKALGDASVGLDFSGLMTGIRALSFVPVGVRHLVADAVEPAMQGGWAILRNSTDRELSSASKDPANEHTQSAVEDEKTHPSGAIPTYTTERVKVISRPVRSGQQVYAPHGDLVVLSQTGAGSEILAEGSVHVYGSVAGRVLAGVNGDRSARIFCQGLEAELISIAGCYQLLDEMDTPLKGQPAMIYLVGDKLKIEPMV